MLIDLASSLLVFLGLGFALAWPIAVRLPFAAVNAKGERIAGAKVLPFRAVS